MSKLTRKERRDLAQGMGLLIVLIILLGLIGPYKMPVERKVNIKNDVLQRYSEALIWGRHYGERR